MYPCPLGQVYVLFNSIHEHELMIQTSPHSYGNDTFSFLPHNKAWNNMALVMTHEVRLLMLGLNLDLWTQPFS